MHRCHVRVPAARSTFAGFRFPPEVITVAVRWYLRYGLSYRDVEELLAERGIEIDHVTVFRRVQRFTPLLIDAARPCRHVPGDRWFADETSWESCRALGLLVPRDRPVWPGHRRLGVREAGLGGHSPVLYPGSGSWHPVGAELVIHCGDLRHRWTVVVGVIVGRGGSPAVSELLSS